MGGQGLHVLLKSGDKALALPDLLREVAQHIVLHLELLALMVRFQNAQAGHINVEVHLLPDERIARAQGFDLRIGKGGLVHVLAGAHRGFGGHNLRDELLLILHRLPQVRIEGALGDIAVDMHFLVLVALTDDTALALLQVSGPPGAVQVVQGDEPVLDVCACTHFGGTAHEHPHLSAPHLGEKLISSGIGVGVVDKGDLMGGDASGNQLVQNVLIDGERRVRLDIAQAVHQRMEVCASRNFISRRHRALVPPGGGFGLGCGNITEHKLGQPVRLPLPPNAEDVVHAPIYLAVGVVREHGVDKPLVQAQLAPVRRDLEHVVDVRVDPCVYLRGPFGKVLHHGLLMLGGFRFLHMVNCLWKWELELVGGLDVRRLLEHGHELRQVEEAGEPGPRPVAGALRGQLNGRHRLPENGGPVVKVAQVCLFQEVYLEIPLHGVKLGHAVGDRGAGGEHHALAACDLVDIPAFQQHIAGLLCIAGGEARHIAHFGVEEQVFIAVRLVYKEAVHTKLLKGHNAVLPGGGVELFQAHSQGLFHPLQLLDGVPLRTAGLQLCNAVLDLRNLLLNQPLPPLHGDRQPLKLGVSHYHGVVVACGNFGTEPFPVAGLKIFFCGDKNVCGGIEAQELGGPLFHQMVGDGKEGLAAQAKPLALHGGGHHLKGLARAHLMGQKGVFPIENVGNRVALVLPQGDLRVHAGKYDVLPIVLAGPNGVESVIVGAYQLLAALGVLPNPVLESVFEGLLLLLGQGGLLLVENTALRVAVPDGIVNADIPQVQGVLQDAVGAGPPCAEVHVGRHIVIGDGGLVGDGPLHRKLRVQDPHPPAQIPRRLQGLIHELLDILLVDPRRAQAQVDLGGVQILGERLPQRLHVILIHGVRVRRPLRLRQLLPDVAGEVFVCRRVLGTAHAVRLIGDAENDAPQLGGQLRLSFAGELGHVGHVYPRLF